MKNVVLTKANPKGWFLTIGDDSITNRWAVTSEELWILRKVLDDNVMEIAKELEKKDTNYENRK